MIDWQLLQQLKSVAEHWTTLAASQMEGGTVDSEHISVSGIESKPFLANRHLDDDGLSSPAYPIGVC